MKETSMSELTACDSHGIPQCTAQPCVEDTGSGGVKVREW